MNKNANLFGQGRRLTMPTRFRVRCFLIVLTISLQALAGCRSADKSLQICEQMNSECHQNCGAHNNDSADFGQSKTATQWISQCDIRCEKNYQGCLKRQKNKQVPGTHD